VVVLESVDCGTDPMVVGVLEGGSELVVVDDLEALVVTGVVL
jgi:hypothetical protein